MEDQMEAILKYFEKEMEQGKTEFRLAVTKKENGVDLLIHPMGKDGETLDLYLERHHYRSTNFGKK